MTERKPPGTSWESWVDRQVREAAERGAFDDLPGAGKPLPDVDGPHDENWWIRRKLKEEGLSADVLLPPALALRKEAERLPETVAGLDSEESVRAAVRELNLRIAAYVRTPTPPWVPVRPVDADAVVAAWRAARAPADPPPPPAPPAPRARRRRWWRRS